MKFKVVWNKLSGSSDFEFAVPERNWPILA
jgi:hypothetical protein